MQILSHRGFWKTPEEKNGRAAFERSFASGFGTETDIRDCQGELVISHDPPVENALSVVDFLEIYRNSGIQAPLALNVKSDGLQQPLAKLLTQLSIDSYFVFDMSIPDMLGYLNAGLNVFTRHSDLEPDPVLYDEARGVWMDTLRNEWITHVAVEKHLAKGKQVAIVSPELHGRDHRQFWKMLEGWGYRDNLDVMLCTDLPMDAHALFGNDP